jgi:osmoprotectant transport system permease protein
MKMIKLMRMEKVSLSGIAIGLCAFLWMDLIMLRPNRLFPGELLSARQLLGTTYLLLLLCWLLLPALVLLKKNHALPNFLAGTLAGLITVACFWKAGQAGQLVSTGDMPFARVSISGGLWVMLLAAYIVIFACSRQLKGHAALRYLMFALVPLLLAVFLLRGDLNGLSIMKEFMNRRESFLHEFNRHLFLSFSAVGAGGVAGIALGYSVFKKRLPEKPAFLLINLAQTLPTLSLLALFMIPLTFLGQNFPLLGRLGIRGVGWAPAVIVLFLYSLLPITRNTLSGFRVVDPQEHDTARAMGMSSRQIFWKIELPLALPVILSGIRTAMTQTIGNTILAGLIGAGGLGSIIFLGLAQAAPDLILLGTLPVILLAWLADWLMQLLTKLITPKGVRQTHDFT